MDSTNRRTDPRIPYLADIQYAPPDADTCLKSRMYNFSKNGMYLEAPQCLPLGATVEIYKKEPSPGIYGPEAYQLYVGDIRWCREVRGKKRRRYGMGVRFLERRQVPSPPEGRVMCDLCGVLTHASECRSVDGAARFCRACRNHLEGLPEEKLQEFVHRFDIGEGG
jgi:hypothetical protein